MTREACGNVGGGDESCEARPTRYLDGEVMEGEPGTRAECPRDLQGLWDVQIRRKLGIDEQPGPVL
jgi:hypothetical protein